jgi:hypothetical protein
LLPRQRERVPVPETQAWSSDADTGLRPRGKRYRQRPLARCRGRSTGGMPGSCPNRLWLRGGTDHRPRCSIWLACGIGQLDSRDHAGTMGSGQPPVVAGILRVVFGMIVVAPRDGYSATEPSSTFESVPRLAPQDHQTRGRLPSDDAATKLSSSRCATSPDAGRCRFVRGLRPCPNLPRCIRSDFIVRPT